MAYIEIKTINGKQYKYLRKTVRDGQKMEHITLKYLGPVNPVPEKRGQHLELGCAGGEDDVGPALAHDGADYHLCAGVACGRCHRSFVTKDHRFHCLPFHRYTVGFVVKLAIPFRRFAASMRARTYMGSCVDLQMSVIHSV